MGLNPSILSKTKLSGIAGVEENTLFTWEARTETSIISKAKIPNIVHYILGL